ncbi:MULTISPECIES: NAD(P)/FAD-dependent oxidoreductase [Okeania]|uniref:NAD(P)/FAD-dependent oxidoreductase n=1 Tax=Okeania hirsuta TaxID=1458930 RepID=A0A3N6PUL2_9CYAN|nr:MULTISPECIES: NAD(P)/FAD-dependent oxidoreductase [Okeania]NEP04386.1 NAD(P)/FAD-dependent oxidoreductase [Okeania sp. SIO4D6]NEP44281.1 NAD(P)/FAD-dependent oxidoreductase [Okeania sp. SIO2H7]NET13416.1 NAD(P)/FAD-dependent oxidoreductase [Okeania sp. SIO1H6]NEP72840.1 NAD(P)/FAD-dependent oxidoreductase [Okeania sp. SIO2G5]NEP93627.1 NAD(P)/FAD-dependent oxidoreductase [Okeania sp. SIO2F5]
METGKISETVEGSNVATKICILGGGFGGLYTALYLQSFRGFKHKNCQIILIDSQDHIVFTPLLYEVITDELKTWEIAPSFDKLLKNKDIQFCQDTVEDIDLKTSQVKLLEGGNLPYDYLVIAVGVTNGKIPNGAENVLTFRTLADTQRLEQKLQSLENSSQEKILVSIVGGGPSGVELAGKIADRLGKRGEIRLIERGKEILKSFTPATRKNAQRALDKRNVLISLQTGVNAIETDKITILQAGETAVIPTDLILWTAGTQMRELVKNLDCSHNSRGQLICEPTLQLVDYPEVFALGDVAEISYPNNQQLPATAQVAYQQASQAAKNLWKTLNNKRPRPFHYLHLGEMITLGMNTAAISSFGISLSGSFAALVRLGVYIQRLPTLSHKFKVIRHRLQVWWQHLFGKSASHKKLR